LYVNVHVVPVRELIALLAKIRPGDVTAAAGSTIWPVNFAA
jgi:hypothetical protein